MPSPFPGMDPYLEGYLWPDVHHRLATQISDQLAPALRPRYVARIEIQVVPDESPGEEIGIMYPDVEIMHRQPVRAPITPVPAGVMVADAPFYTVSSVKVPVFKPEVRIATVEIRDTAQNQLVTAIEILSPVNKREPGLTVYRQKWDRLASNEVHIIEIDLLRRGQRPYSHSRIPESPYRVRLARTQTSFIEVWAIQLQEKLPTLPVPLRVPDADVPLELAAAFATIYDRAGYDLSVNYGEDPPPPPLSEGERVWAQAQVQMMQI